MPPCYLKNDSAPIYAESDQDFVRSKQSAHPGLSIHTSQSTRSTSHTQPTQTTWPNRPIMPVHHSIARGQCRMPPAILSTVVFIFVVEVLLAGYFTGNFIPNMGGPCRTEGYTTNTRITVPALAPQKANFLMEFNITGLAFLYGICWLDPTHLLVPDNHGRKLIKVRLNFQQKTYTKEVYASGHSYSRITCPGRGQVYATSNDSPSTILVYVDGQESTWQPAGVGKVWNIAANDMYVVVYSDNDNCFVYNREHILVYIQKHVNKFGFDTWPDMHLGPGNILMATDSAGPSLLIWNLASQVFRSIWGQDSVMNDCPVGVTSDPSGLYILVADCCINKIYVFAINGTFLHTLEVGSGATYNNTWYLALIPRPNQTSLLAVSNYMHKTGIKSVNGVNIYELNT